VFAGDFFPPIGALAVEHLNHGDVGHGRGGCGAVPMLFCPARIGSSARAMGAQGCLCLASSPNPSLRRPRKFSGWLVQANPALCRGMTAGILRTAPAGKVLLQAFHQIFVLPSPIATLETGTFIIHCLCRTMRHLYRELAVRIEARDFGLGAGGSFRFRALKGLCGLAIS
jgi:hypothetical protein